MIDTRLSITGSLQIPLEEFEFRTSRSGGPGGQHVNKVESRVELLFNVGTSPSLSNRQRELLLSRLRSRIDARGVLRIAEGGSRSQWKNKQEALKRFQLLLRSALRPVKKRRPTGPTPSSVERRLRGKKLQKEKKTRRRSLDD